jgi:hypothetical protein
VTDTDLVLVGDLDLLGGDSDLNVGGDVSWPTQQTDAELVSLGSIPSQAPADALRDLWIAFIRDVGDGSPTHATHQYLGGDVTDVFVNSAGKVVWVGADWFAGATVDASGFYGGQALPIRNGLIHWDTANSFTGAIQAHAVGNSGVWLDAVTQLGLAAGTILWPIAAFDDGGTQKTLCWHVESPAAGGAPHGRLIDSYIVTFNIFLGYDSHIASGLGALSDKFWFAGVLRDTTHTYVLGMEFVPDFDRRTTGGAQANYVLGNPTEHYSLTRIARVVNGSFNTMASWTFWNGTTWVAGVQNAVPIVDTNGQPVKGDLGMKKISTGRYLFGAHPLTDTHVNVYTATAPQGPLLQTNRIPVADQGKAINNGIQVGQLCKFVPSTVTTTPAVPAEHSLFMMSCNLIDPAVGYAVPETWTSVNTRRFAPRFVVVPHH